MILMVLSDILRVAISDTFASRYVVANNHVREAFRNDNQLFVDSAVHSPRRIVREGLFVALSLYDATLYRPGSASYKH